MEVLPVRLFVDGASKPLGNSARPLQSPTAPRAQTEVSAAEMPKQSGKHAQVCRRLISARKEIHRNSVERKPTAVKPALADRVTHFLPIYPFLFIFYPEASLHFSTDYSIPNPGPKQKRPTNPYTRQGEVMSIN